MNCQGRKTEFQHFSNVIYFTICYDIDKQCFLGLLILGFGCFLSPAISHAVENSEEWLSLDTKEFSVRYPASRELNQSGAMGTAFLLFSEEDSIHISSTKMLTLQSRIYKVFLSTWRSTWIYHSRKSNSTFPVHRS